MTDAMELTKYSEELKRRGMSSPSGMYWDRFWKLLKSKGGEDEADKLLVPLILGGSLASDAVKHERLVHQLEWAGCHGCLKKALEYLRRLHAPCWNQAPLNTWEEEFTWDDFDDDDEL